MTDHLDKDQKFTGKLTEIILANLGNENFGVKELAQQAGMSHFILSRKLQAASGKTINQFIRETRLETALVMLQNDDITAAEVAFKTGFGSPTYFNTCFNEFYGYPPGKVKKGAINFKNELKPVQTYNDRGKIVSRKQLLIYIPASVLFIIIVFYLLNFNILKDDEGSKQNQATDIKKSIAVLPFKNLSDSAGNQYFADGITEDILTILSRLRDLRVISRTSVEQFRDSKLSTSEIAKKLKVKYIIEGSVQKSGNMFRLWIQLIDAKEGDHLWAEVYDGKYSADIFDFQSSIANKVAKSLDVVITPKEEQKINRNPTNDILAHELYMKGQVLMRKWDYEGDEKYLKLSLNAYESALKIDPHYVIALLGKALALSRLGMHDSSLVCYQRVLIIDKENPDALGGIGGYYLFTNKPDTALIYLQKSIDCNINNENCFWNYLAIGQVFFMYRNDIKEAFLYLQKAYENGGESWPEIHYTISLLYSSIGEFSKAFKYNHNALSMTSSCRYLRTSSYILISQGKYVDAGSFIDSIGMIMPCEQECDIMRCYLFTNQKKFDKADIYLRKAISSGYKLVEDDYLYTSCLYKGTGMEYENLSNLKSIAERGESLIQAGKSFWLSETALRVAACYAILGDNEKALVYLKILEKMGCNDNPFPLRTFPGFDNLRNNPEFKAIVKRIEDERASIRAQVKGMELREEIKL